MTLPARQKGRKAGLEGFSNTLDSTLELLPDVERTRGTSVWVALSLLVHGLLMTYIVVREPVARHEEQIPVARYVELMKQPPTPSHTEAPGAKTDKAPMNAPLSNANRKASMPQPTGENPTTRPGNGTPVYAPGNPMPRGPAPRRAAQPSPQISSLAKPPQQQPQTGEPRQMPDFALQVPSEKQEPVRASAGVDWRSAIRNVGQIASLGGGDQTMGSQGGEQGFAESGPVSFETQWYPWGDYADIMVRRIRANWYANMPSVIRMGLKGVVVIRFTILRSGQITEVTMLSGSDVPPFDFAAKKAIEISSPLPPLPADFPNPSEHVTCAFYYNLTPPKR